MCCISSTDEAIAAIAAGADAVGLVADMPSGPGVITDEQIRDIVATLSQNPPAPARSDQTAAVAPPISAASVSTFLLTARTRGRDIVEHIQFCGTSAVQIVRHIAPEEYAVIIRALPHVQRVQVIHVEDESCLELIPIYEPLIDAFLLDSGRPGNARSGEKPELGGTGRVHDWEISACFVRTTKRPVFLAGGLDALNVGEAIRRVRPYGVDLCSGVRTDTHLDTQKLEQFMRAVKCRA